MAVDRPLAHLDVARRAIERGQSLYFRPEDAKELVRECEAGELAVIGVEGLTLDEQGITPRLDLIADYTASPVDWDGYDWEEFRRTCNAAAVEFLEMAGHLDTKHNVVFDFALMRRGDFEEFRRRAASVSRRR